MNIRSILFAFLCACSNHPTESVAKQEPVPWLPPKTEVVQPKLDAQPAAKPEDKKIVPPAIAEQPALPSTYADAIKEGKELAAKGDQLRAQELFLAAAKMDKKRAEPYVELARSYIAGDERGKAIAAANKAVKLAPESTGAWNTLGRAELLRKNYDGAITAFDQAVTLDKDNVWAWNNLGYTELTLKHYDKAIDALVEATSRPNATGYMFNNLGTAYEQLDKLDDAREAFDKGSVLGSAEAKSSRKRLEGVKTLALTKPLAPDELSKGWVDDKGDVQKGEPKVEEPEADKTVTPAAEEPKAEEPKAEEPKADESKVKVESVEVIDAGVPDQTAPKTTL